MTTITIDRKLLEEVVEIFDNNISTRYPHEILRDIRAALAAPATAPEPVAWINGHDLRLLGRQGRGALVWCDKEGNADTPLYLHPPATAPEPMFWVRIRSDGMYEGPLHNAQIEKVRKESGSWRPLYLHPPADERHAQELLAQDITIGKMAERHAQELCAYELTVQNLRAELDLALSQLAAEGRINSETLKVLEEVEKKLEAAMATQEQIK